MPLALYVVYLNILKGCFISEGASTSHLAPDFKNIPSHGPSKNGTSSMKALSPLL